MNSPDKDPMLRFLVSPRYRFYRHFLLWLVFALLIYNPQKQYKGNADYYVGITILLIVMTLLYINLKLLVPRLLLKGRYIYYTLGILSLSLLTFGVFFFSERYILNDIRLVPKADAGQALLKVMFGFAVFFCILLLACTAIKLFQRWIIDTHRIHELETSRMQSELNQLKSQINPHFLFNMLNNANVLTQKDPAKASEVLMRLSDLLRYQLYDSARNKVLLSSDIHFLSDFLNLEKIRRDQFEFAVTSQGHTHELMIPPFLFITFVENAVKHNMDANGKSFVHITFKVSTEHLQFSCVNSKPLIPMPKPANSGGLGLANARRRLELLYPNKHNLDIEEKADTYTVNLGITL